MFCIVITIVSLILYISYNLVVQHSARFAIIGRTVTSMSSYQYLGMNKWKIQLFFIVMARQNWVMNQTVLFCCVFGGGREKCT